MPRDHHQDAVHANELFPLRQLARTDLVCLAVVHVPLLADEPQRARGAAYERRALRYESLNRGRSVAGRELSAAMGDRRVQGVLLGRAPSGRERDADIPVFIHLVPGAGCGIPATVAVEVGILCLEGVVLLVDFALGKRVSDVVDQPLETVGVIHDQRRELPCIDFVVAESLDGGGEFLCIVRLGEALRQADDMGVDEREAIFRQVLRQADRPVGLAVRGFDVVAPRVQPTLAAVEFFMVLLSVLTHEGLPSVRKASGKCG